MRRALLPLLGVAAVLPGCAMVPRYDRPSAPVPASWWSQVEGASAAQLDAQAAADAPSPWQSFFTDPRLRDVIGVALANNRDLRVATLAVERAQALHRIQGSGLYPGIGIQAAGAKTRIPEKIAEDGVAYDSEQYSVHVGTMAWELDLFGRIRSQKAAALQQYLATRAGRRAAQVSLVAAVTATYLAVAADAEELSLSLATLESQEASLELLRRSSDAGIASDLDVSQVESQVETARNAMARWRGQLAVDRDALDLLAGAPLRLEMLPDRLDQAVDARALSPGLPSDVLLNRPDVVAAEHQLMAANANIGAARAAFFPRISLTAALGTLSPQLSSLFGSGTRTWTFVPQATAPLWAGGYQRANLRLAKVERQIAVAQYEKAIQSAFAEVSDALSLRTTLIEQREAQEALVAALDRTHRLSSARYEAGVDGYLGVLVAQRALFAGQQALVGARLSEQANVVALYKALGGGV